LVGQTTVVEKAHVNAVDEPTNAAITGADFIVKRRKIE
jgi:hypothetical protein